MKTLSTTLYFVAKRLFDVSLAVALLLGLLPVLGIVALGIWLESGPPILFTQMRAGRDGKPFRLFKFRTLKLGPKDPTRPGDYTTSLGHPLRRWAIDELPQLWNVLRGDMSLVGPRPTLPEQVEKYSARERIRLRVRPGLTGWAQIHGRNALSWSERINYDIWYVRNRHFRLDLQIIIRTPKILIQGTGVYGPDDRNPYPSSPSS